MIEENPYESPETINEVEEQHRSKKFPALLKTGLGLMAVGVGLQASTLFLLLCDLWNMGSSVSSGSQPRAGASLSLNIGMPILKIGTLAGALGAVLMITSGIIQFFSRKKISALKTKSKSNG
jgi:hypothetical protein